MGARRRVLGVFGRELNRIQKIVLLAVFATLRGLRNLHNRDHAVSTAVSFDGREVREARTASTVKITIATQIRDKPIHLSGVILSCSTKSARKTEWSDPYTAPCRSPTEAALAPPLRKEPAESP